MLGLLLRDLPEPQMLLQGKSHESSASRCCCCWMGRTRGITWLEAHFCLSAQSLWLRTYHHCISRE